MMRNGRVLVVGGFGPAGDKRSAQFFDPVAGSWTTTNPMVAPRATHTATLLADGTVLAVGGEDDFVDFIASVERYNPVTGTWMSVDPLLQARSGHTATLLNDGTVLVAGGVGSGGPLAGAELFHPDSNSWTPAASLGQARRGHQAVRLGDGSVLVAGGGGPDGDLDSVERYIPGPAGGSWVPAAPMSTARSGHTLTKLADGRVLAVGGSGSDGGLASAEIYDPAANVWTATGSLNTGRSDHTATAVGNGVIVTGGLTQDAAGDPVVLASVERFDPGGTPAPPPGVPGPALVGAQPASAPATDATPLRLTGTGLLGATAVLFGSTPAASFSVRSDTRIDAVAPSGPAGRVPVSVVTPAGTSASDVGFTRVATSGGQWRPAGQLATGRTGHTATQLLDGRVLVVGGSGAGGLLSSVEAYDPTSGKWTAAADLPSPRAGHTATRLNDGRVLVAGGRSAGTDGGPLASTQLYDPAADRWADGPPMGVAREGHNATRLSDGRVLVTGGSVPCSQPTSSLASAEIYDPVAGRWLSTGGLAEGRNDHTATLMSDGRVLVLGGYRGCAFDEPPNFPLAAPEAYDPAGGTWSGPTPNFIPRLEQTSVRVADGRVLEIGGYPGNVGPDTTPTAAMEAYDPAAGTWLAVRSLRAARAQHEGNLLGDGTVLVEGGETGPGGGVLQSAERYDATTGQWSYTGSMAVARHSHTATMLLNGEILVVGGRGAEGEPLASAERYALAAPVPGLGSGSQVAAVPKGYRLGASDGGVFAFGGAPFLGSMGGTHLNQPIVGLAANPVGTGYWLAASDGGVFAFGDAPYAGSTGRLRLNQPVVGMAATPSGRGYWLVAADGGVFAFGDAPFWGSTASIRLRSPIVGIVASPTGKGYRLVAADGGVFAFGDALYLGSTGRLRLNRPVVGAACTPNGNGYWLVAADGGVFAFGEARFAGSTGNLPLRRPMVGMAATPSGAGYWLVAADGGVFAFGDAPFLGSTGGLRLNRPVVGMALG